MVVVSGDGQHRLRHRLAACDGHPVAARVVRRLRAGADADRARHVVVLRAAGARGRCRPRPPASAVASVDQGAVVRAFAETEAPGAEPWQPGAAARDRWWAGAVAARLGAWGRAPAFASPRGTLAACAPRPPAAGPPAAPRPRP